MLKRSRYCLYLCRFEWNVRTAVVPPSPLFNVCCCRHSLRSIRCSSLCGPLRVFLSLPQPTQLTPCGCFRFPLLPWLLLPSRFYLVCSGQLGLGHNFTAKEQTPQKVPSLSRAKITQLACGQDHTAVLTSESRDRCHALLLSVLTSLV